MTVIVFLGRRVRVLPFRRASRFYRSAKPAHARNNSNHAAILHAYPAPANGTGGTFVSVLQYRPWRPALEARRSITPTRSKTQGLCWLPHPKKLIAYIIDVLYIVRVLPFI